MFVIQLKQFKSYTRGCICDIENKILQKKMIFDTSVVLWSILIFMQKLNFGAKNHKMTISQKIRQN